MGMSSFTLYIGFLLSLSSMISKMAIPVPGAEERPMSECCCHSFGNLECSKQMYKVDDEEHRRFGICISRKADVTVWK